MQETYCHFDFYGLGASLLTGTVDALSKIDDMKKMMALQEDVNNLSAAQQAELENKLSQVKTQIEKESVIYKYIAIAKHERQLDKIKTTRLIMAVVIVSGLAGLAVVLLKLKK